MSCAKWMLWALLGLLVLYALMWFNKREPIEQDIQQRTTQALHSAGHDWADVDLNRRGRDVLLKGAAPSDDARLSAIALTEEVYGVRIVEDQTTLLELASPSFNLRHQGEKIVLSGAMPTQDDIDATMTAAARAFGSQNLINRMNIDQGVRQPDWLEGMNTLMPSIAKLREANIQINDETRSFGGLVEDAGTKTSLLAGVNGLFNSGVSSSITVQPSGPSAEELAQAAADKAAALAAERAKADAERIATEQTKAYEAEKARTEQADRLAAEQAKAKAKAAEQAKRLAAEQAKAVEQAKKLAAEQAEAVEQAKKLAAEQAKAVEQAKKLAAEQAKATEQAKAEAARLAKIEADRKAIITGCQTRLNNTMHTQNINFASGSAAVDSSSYPLLNQIAGLIAECRDAIGLQGGSIEVAGHTDATGDEDMNLTLSNTRANAVRDYLVKQGVSSTLLSAKGYGELAPLADNSTAEGRAQNRRIQFDIKQ